MKKLFNKHWHKFMYGGLFAILSFDAMVIHLQPILMLDGKSTNMTEPILMMAMLFCFVVALIGLGALVSSIEHEEIKKKTFEREQQVADLNQEVSEQRFPLMIALKQQSRIIQLRGDNASFRAFQNN